MRPIDDVSFEVPTRARDSDIYAPSLITDVVRPW
jgi:hypothetical protein